MEDYTATSSGPPATYPDPNISSSPQVSYPDPHLSSDQPTTYPDPTKTNHSPYPFQNTSASSASPASTYYSAWPGKPPSWTSSPAKSTGEFMSLADYFNLGSANRRQSQRTQHANGNDSDDDSEAEAEAEAFSSAIRTSGSLPGYHFLPEHDRVSSDFINGQRGSADIPTAPTRGARRSRGEDSGRGRGRGWKQLLKGTEHEGIFSKPKKRQSTGKRPGRPRATDMGEGSKRIDPGREFTEAQTQATQAFLNGNYDEALDLALKAVKANSEMFAAHHLVHKVLQIQGHERDAFEALTMGAVTKRDAPLWIELSQRLLQFEGDDKREDDAERAMNFLRTAVVLDKTGKEPRVAKLNLYIEFEDWNRARRECRVIVQKWPDDLEKLMLFGELCERTSDSSEWQRGAEIYQNAFSSWTDEGVFGDAEQQWTHLNVYLQLLAKASKFAEAVFELKRLARWFLGRKEDTFWDEVREDDREYDIDNSRKVHHWQFQQGRISRDPKQYGEGLPLDIRVKLGLLRLNMGLPHRNEALRHLEHLRNCRGEPEEYADLFFEVGESFRQMRLYADALKFYEPISSLPSSAQNRFRMCIAQCYSSLQRYSEAQAYYEAILETDRTDLEARAVLAKVYEQTEQHAKAQVITAQLRQIGRADLLKKYRVLAIAPSTRGQEQGPNGQASPTLHNASFNLPSNSAFQRSRPSNEAVSFGAQRTRVQKHRAALEALSSSTESEQAEKTVQQWVHHAEKMLAEFKSTKAFFHIPSKTHYSTDLGSGMSLKDRLMIKEMEAINRRTQDRDGASLGQFLDISFTDWHRMLSELALLYAKHVKQDKCYDILQNVLMKAAIFRRDQALQNTTLAICMCCAQMFNDSKLMTETARQFIDAGQTGSKARTPLLAASGRLASRDSHPTDRNIQNWILRLIREKDYLTMPADMRSNYQWGFDHERLQTLAAKTGPSTADVDAGLLAIYADIANSHRRANADPGLPYLLRALALEPENLVINLNLATTYVANAMEKTADNRQYDVAQGLSFLYRYYDLRVTSGKACHLQEAEYNVARVWHQLGLTHLAVPAYEKVLSLSDQVQKEYAEENDGDVGTEDFSKEAAFALQSIFALAGNEAAAQSITEEWLVL